MYVMSEIKRVQLNKISIHLLQQDEIHLNLK